jgi:hypothetical protein
MKRLETVQLERGADDKLSSQEAGSGEGAMLLMSLLQTLSSPSSSLSCSQDGAEGKFCSGGGGEEGEVGGEKQVLLVEVKAVVSRRVKQHTVKENVSQSVLEEEKRTWGHERKVSAPSSSR